MYEYIINGVQYSQTVVHSLTQNDFIIRSISQMPKSLFKYYPDTVNNDGINHSIYALMNNTVYLQTPLLFDDPYDCTIRIDKDEFTLARIKYYAGVYGVKFQDDWNYEKIFQVLAEYLYNKIISENSLYIMDELPENAESVTATHIIFFNEIKLELQKNRSKIDAWQIAVGRAINNEYNRLQEALKKFRVACFTKSPYSMRMWSHYANCHKGFCIEYEIPPYDSNEDLFHSLFPVIYSNIRTNIVKSCMDYLNSNSVTREVLWDCYKYGLLTKSMDWIEQEEWRLISLETMLTDENYNCKFFKIKKVYLGTKMKTEDRTKIIDICKRFDIPYVGLIMLNDSYELKECSQLCETCIKCIKMKKENLALES